MEKFTQYSNFFYTAVGIDPYDKGGDPGKSRLRALFLANVINLTIVAICESIYVYTAFQENKLLEAVTVMSYVGFDIVGISKMLFIRWKKTGLNEILEDLEAIFPKGKVQEEKYDLPKYLRTCSGICLTYASLYSLLIWTFNLFSVMEYLVYEKWLKTRVVGKGLPYLMYVPWKWEDSWSYYPLLFSQNFAGYTAAAGQISTDLLFCAVATQLVMHFDFLSSRMMTHKLSGNWKKDSKFLSDMVRYHERILRLTDVVNDVFGIPLLLNFMVSSFVICFVGFQMTVGVAPDMVVKLFLFLFSSMSQVYLICHYGQMVADASFGLSVATYSQNWVHADVRYKRALVIIISRAQNVTFLKATIFLNITRSSMTDLLQISYKFFALLRTMYAQ
ncbi:odorant receptor 85b-like [Drosophila ficusphila]|uniref:odorant receptor 85b-like n=1 Tax=Drosophila ficusphila TaxID=30025 RepID=UPI001C890999|nr:odorant receptor 85b-like [Drosophila ficusphila]